MYTTGQLAMRIERTYPTIATWEKHGRIPKAMYRSLQNRRLYTAFQVQYIEHFYKRVKHNYGNQIARFNIGRTYFFHKIKQLWINFPYGVEELKGPRYVEDTED
jgi:hypothetical protein